MPFGLCNATAAFQRLMVQALTNVTEKYGNLIMCYVDDVVIATPTLEDQIRRLDEVFGCMKQAGLKCKPSKCEILRDSIKYLGRLVDKHGVRQDPEVVEAALTWKAPKTDTQLMSFLGFANYYREFIKGMQTKYTPCKNSRKIKARNPAGLMRLRSPLRIMSAKSARLRSWACRQKGAVRVRHGRLSGCDIGHTSPRTRMERMEVRS